MKNKKKRDAHDESCSGSVKQQEQRSVLAPLLDAFPFNRAIIWVGRIGAIRRVHDVFARLSAVIPPAATSPDSGEFVFIPLYFGTYIIDVSVFILLFCPLCFQQNVTWHINRIRNE